MALENWVWENLRLTRVEYSGWWQWRGQRWGRLNYGKCGRNSLNGTEVWKIECHSSSSVHGGTYDLERKTFQSRKLSWDYRHNKGKWEKVVKIIMKTEAVGALEKRVKCSSSPSNLDPLWAASPEESDCSNHLICAARLHSRGELMIPSFHLILSIALGEAVKTSLSTKGSQLEGTSFVVIFLLPLLLPLPLSHNDSISLAELLSSLAYWSK